MNEIGIFEAKTKFPGLCDQVVRTGSPILVRRRGKPLVIVSPANLPSKQNEGIMERWQAWENANPEDGDSDFPEVWTMRQDNMQNPLEE